VTSIAVAPNSDEWSLGSGELVDLVGALKQRGFDPWLQEPRENYFSQGGIVIDPLVDVSFFLWEKIADETVAILVGIALEKLRRRGKRKRPARGVIYGPAGEVLKTFEIPGDEPDV
jgi:hypothetical protein